MGAVMSPIIGGVYNKNRWEIGDGKREKISKPIKDILKWAAPQKIGECSRTEKISPSITLHLQLAASLLTWPEGRELPSTSESHTQNFSILPLRGETVYSLLSMLKGNWQGITTGLMYDNFPGAT